MTLLRIFDAARLSLQGAPRHPGPRSAPMPEPGNANRPTVPALECSLFRAPFWGSRAHTTAGYEPGENRPVAGPDSLGKDNFHPRRRITVAGKDATPNEID
jgi:hypothetical protein